MKPNNSIFYVVEHKQLNILWQGALLILGLFMINAMIYSLDGRMLGDEKLWLKPMKFQISVAMHLITLAVLAAYLNPKDQQGKPWTIWSYAVVVAGMFEVLYIFLQAARGRESHFNFSSNIEGFMYSLMGIGALTLVATSFYLGIKLYKEYKNQANAMLLSSALGLTLGSVLTLIIAGYLSQGIEVSTKAIDTSARLPISGWYLNGKDLRIPHFLATHMMQLIPLYGFWLAHKNNESTGNIRKVKIMASTYSLIVLGLFALSFI